jgi:hypothetical protein
LNDFDDEDEGERGRALVSTAAGWRAEVASWIGQAREDEEISMSEPDGLEFQGQTASFIQSRVAKFKQMKLSELFNEAPKRRTRVSDSIVDEEAALMEALAEAEEDDRLDDGAIEVSEDEYDETV